MPRIRVACPDIASRSAFDDVAIVWQGARHIAHSAATIALITPIEPDPDRARWAGFDLGQAMIAMAVVTADQGIASAHALIGDSERRAPDMTTKITFLYGNPTDDDAFEAAYADQHLELARTIPACATSSRPKSGPMKRAVPLAYGAYSI